MHENPDLRIISDELWAAAQRRLATPTTNGGSSGNARPKSLLSGTLRCGLCGGPVIAVSAHRYGCAWHKDRGDAVCAGLLVPRHSTEQRLLDVLREDLLSPICLSQMHSDVRELLKQRRATADSARDKTRGRLAQIESELANIIGAIKAGAYSQTLQAELARLESEREELKAVTEGADQPSQASKPKEILHVVERYRSMVAELRHTLHRKPERTRTIVREALGEVTLVREGDAIFAEFEDPAERMLLAASGGISPNGSGGRI